MGPLERRVLETLVNSSEIGTSGFSAVEERERLPRNRLNGSSLEAPHLLPPSHLAKQFFCKSDRQRFAATEVLPCAIEEERRAWEHYSQAAG